MRPGRSVPAPVLVLGSVFTVQTGQALGKGLIGEAGAMGVVTLRLGFAALLLLLLWRPRPPERRSLGLIVSLGLAMAAMQTIFLAIERIPIGVASTLQFLGPLTIALAGSRRAADVGWAVLAALVLLGEHLGRSQWLAVGCVCAASAGVVATARRRDHAHAPEYGSV